MKPAYLFASLGAGLKASQIAVYLGAGVMILSGTAGLLHGSENIARSMGPFYFIAFGLVMWWSVTANRALLLMQDIHRLHMPGAMASVLAGLALHFIFTVFVPAIVIAAAGAVAASPMLAFGTCLVLTTLVGPLLPSPFGFAGGLIGLLPLLSWMLVDKGVLPGVRDAGFSLYAWSAALAMAAVLFRRRHWLFLDGAEGDGGNLALGRFRAQLLAGGFNSDAFAGGMSALGAAKRIRLERAGPKDPVRAIQAWLGMPFAPMSLPMQAQRYLLPLLLSVATAFVFVSLNIVNTMGLVIIMFGQNIYMVLRSLFLPRLQSVFAAQGGDLEFLGTLPGTGRGRVAGRNVLAAVFPPFLIACAMQFVFIVGLAQAMSGTIARQLEHGQCFDLASIIIALACADLGVAVLIVNALVGRVFSKWSEMFLLILGMLVALTVTKVPFASVFANAMEALLVAGFVVPLAWAGASAWREFQRRPHPFLLNS